MMDRAAIAIAAATAAVLTVVGCGAGGSQDSASTPGSFTASPVISAPPVPATPAVTAQCYKDGYSRQETYAIPIDSLGVPNFASAWATPSTSCEVTRNNAPYSALEKRAEDAAEGKGPLHILYQLCATNGIDDVYARPNFALSPDQIAETKGTLTLCPGHPHAPQWRAAMARGGVKADLQSQGRVFNNGTYLVNKEIPPGTYAIEGEIENCYWARQNSAGGVIQNNFVPSGRRVQVTIQAGDYAFNSEGCGEWVGVR